MKTFIAAMFLLSSVTSFAQNKPKPSEASEKPMTETFNVDASATKVEWVGKKITGKHSGGIKVKEGTLTFTGDLITAGTIVVDMTTISVTDIPASDEGNGKLVGHLSSPDFFDSAKYPTSTLVIKSSEKAGKDLKIKGELTMIGQTKPVDFTATVSKTGDMASAKADIVIDRTKWGLKYGSGSFFKGLGDKAINNEFTLSINLSAKK